MLSSTTAGEGRGLLVATLLLAVAAVPLARLGGSRGATARSVAGLAFGATAIASRVLPGDLSLTHLLGAVEELLRIPATYALLVGGALALLSYSIALQRGSVTQATAPLVVGETVAPAPVGVLLLGDHARPGWGWVAVVGFVLAVAGAVSLARHGGVETVPAPR